MTTYKHLLWSAPALLVVAVIVMVGADAPTVSPQATKISQADQKKNQDTIRQIEVRKVEEPSLKSQDVNVKQIEVGKAEESGLKSEDIKEIEIRKEEEHRLKKQDKLYAQQAKALAEQYEQTAKLVASSGGDPKPLLDAAAYFENESK